MIGEIKAGRPINLNGTFVEGDLNISMGQKPSTLRGRIGITNSIINGSLIADRVDFENAVSLNNAAIPGDVSFASARLMGGMTIVSTSIEGKAGFSSCEFYMYPFFRYDVL
ncbi:MAG TPA: hypothetical protein VN455_10340 [Methanotrichaceae archaeon]|nr:hypothetical protein [Methanotrichaceae archaeon]